MKSVSSISITPQSAIHTLSHKLHAFPVGMSAVFSVFLHDNIGRKFDSGNVPLKHRLNRYVVLGLPEAIGSKLIFESVFFDIPR